MYKNKGYNASKGGASRLPNVGDQHNGYTYTKDKIWDGPKYVSPYYKGTNPHCKRDSHDNCKSGVPYKK